jgi:hypothetical protein
MPMVGIQKMLSHALRPNVGIFLTTPGAEFAFTGKRNSYFMSAHRAEISREASFGATTFKHLLYLMNNMGRCFRVAFFEKETSYYPAGGYIQN